MASKADTYGCRVKPGQNRKGCGGGAEVFELKEKIKEQDKRLDKIEAEQKRKDDAAKKLDKRQKSGRGGINVGTSNRPHTEAEKKAHSAGERSGKKK